MILDIYLARTREVGATSIYAPRLAFLYNLMGYQAEARDLLVHAFEAGASSADTHFAMAFLLADEGSFSPERLVEVASHLLAVGQLQASYQGIFTYDQSWLDRTLEQLPAAVLDVADRGLVTIARERVHLAADMNYE